MGLASFNAALRGEAQHHAGRFAGRGLSHLIGNFSDGFSPNFMRQASVNDLSINPFNTNGPIGGIFNEIGRFVFGAKHQVNSVFNMSGTPSPGFSVGNELGEAAHQEVVRLGGGLRSFLGRGFGFNEGIGPVNIFGRVGPDDLLSMVGSGGIFGR